MKLKAIRQIVLEHATIPHPVEAYPGHLKKAAGWHCIERHATLIVIDEKIPCSVATVGGIKSDAWPINLLCFVHRFLWITDDNAHG
ncbi:MAG: hypothetical protein ACR2QH_15270 [Geminicoccaceae bacterium]